MSSDLLHIEPMTREEVEALAPMRVVGGTPASQSARAKLRAALDNPERLATCDTCIELRPDCIRVGGEESGYICGSCRSNPQPEQPKGFTREELERDTYIPAPTQGEEPDRVAFARTFQRWAREKRAQAQSFVGPEKEQTIWFAKGLDCAADHLLVARVPAQHPNQGEGSGEGRPREITGEAESLARTARIMEYPDFSAADAQITLDAIAAEGEEVVPVGTAEIAEKLTEVCPECEGDDSGGGIDEPPSAMASCTCMGGRVPKGSASPRTALERLAEEFEKRRDAAHEQLQQKLAAGDKTHPLSRAKLIACSDVAEFLRDEIASLSPEPQEAPSEADLHPVMTAELELCRRFLTPGGAVAAATNAILDMKLSDDAEQACGMAYMILGPAVRSAAPHLDLSSVEDSR